MKVAYYEIKAAFGQTSKAIFGKCSKFSLLVVIRPKICQHAVEENGLVQRSKEEYPPLIQLIEKKQLIFKHLSARGDALRPIDAVSSQQAPMALQPMPLPEARSAAAGHFFEV